MSCCVCVWWCAVCDVVLFCVVVVVVVCCCGRGEERRSNLSLMSSTQVGRRIRCSTWYCIDSSQSWQMFVDVSTNQPAMFRFYIYRQERLPVNVFLFCIGEPRRHGLASSISGGLWVYQRFAATRCSGGVRDLNHGHHAINESRVCAQERTTMKGLVRLVV